MGRAEWREAVNDYWVSNWSFTVFVHTDSAGFIRDIAPIMRRFKNRPLYDLLHWSRAVFGDTKCVEISLA